MLQSVWACRTIKTNEGTILDQRHRMQIRKNANLSTITGQTITNDDGHLAVICCQHQQHTKEIREKVLNDFLGCVARTNVELANDTDSTYGHQAVSDGSHSGSPLAKRACLATFKHGSITDSKFSTADSNFGLTP